MGNSGQVVRWRTERKFALQTKCLTFVTPYSFPLGQRLALLEVKHAQEMDHQKLKVTL